MKKKSIILLCIIAALLIVGIFMLKVQDTKDMQDTNNKLKQEHAQTDQNNDQNSTLDNKNDSKSNDQKPEITSYDLPKSKEDVIEAFENMVKILYFGEGSYDDYKSLFTDPEKAASKEKFEKYRKNINIKDEFPYSDGTLESIKEHIVIKAMDSEIRVYYVKDPNNEKEFADAKYWKFVRKGNQILIRNDGF